MTTTLAALVKKTKQAAGAVAKAAAAAVPSVQVSKRQQFRAVQPPPVRCNASCFFISDHLM